MRNDKWEMLAPARLLMPPACAALVVQIRLHVSSRLFGRRNGSNKIEIIHRPGRMVLYKRLIIAAHPGPEPDLLEHP